MLTLIGLCQRSPQQLHEESEDWNKGGHALIMTSRNGLCASPTSIAVAFRSLFLSKNAPIDDMNLLFCACGVKLERVIDISDF
jgi:hypothetical protein